MFLYQKVAWGPLVKLLTREDEPTKVINKEAIGALARAQMEAFIDSFTEISQKHIHSYTIPDPDLREQIREATVNFVVPAYKEFVKGYESVLSSKSYMAESEVEGVVVRMFGGGEKEGRVRGNRKDREEERHSESVERPREVRDFRRSKSSAVPEKAYKALCRSRRRHVSNKLKSNRRLATSAFPQRRRRPWEL